MTNLFIKIMLLGDSQSGKTSLFDRLTKNRFLISEPTKGIDFSTYLLKIQENISIKTQIFDTSGLITYKQATQNYYNLANGILL